MKGSPDAPQCGFSQRATQILMACGKEFSFVDILSKPEIREKLPSISNWPTFPQLFIGGELIGGSDIMMDMYQNGEMQTMIDELDIKSAEE
jgi:monothiol glutaredoxin